MKDVNYWLNNLGGNNNKKIQPRTKEEEIASQLAEYLLSRENKKKAA